MRKIRKITLSSQLPLNQDISVDYITSMKNGLKNLRKNKEKSKERSKRKERLNSNNCNCRLSNKRKMKE